MIEAQPSPLLKELRFQLEVTRAMLGALELEQVLHIILSGITHGAGLDLNRAFLLLDEEGDGVLRLCKAVGPASKEEAHRIWEDMERKGLELPDLLAAQAAPGPDEKGADLAGRTANLTVGLDGSAPTVDMCADAVPVQAVVARCALNNEPFFSNDLTMQWRETPLAEPFTFGPFACVPMWLDQRILGVILADNAYNLRPVDKGQVRALSTLANLAAIAIDKARLHRRIRQMALVDGLTDVANRRQYELRLTEEVARAVRTAQPLSLLLFDVDHFKDCNDRHGHGRGDRVLRDLAACLKASVRAGDVVARYGGEEFAVLLTCGTQGRAAQQVAEAIRASVQTSSLGGLPPGEVTVSCGVATLEPWDMDGETLFKRADEALYEAKGAGRNRVVRAT